MCPCFYPRVSQVFDTSTLLAQIRQMGTIGMLRHDGSMGRTRLALTTEEKMGRDQLVRWMKELELDVRVDAMGNIFGILPGTEDKPPLMAGSHIDTVGQAGALDGVYGVLAALAVARAWRTAGMLPTRPFVVAAFTNEEGVRFQPDMMGSLVYSGGLSLETALASTSPEGVSVEEELQRIGYAGAEEPGFIRPAAYLELHVEQGPLLEAEDIQIGIVEGVQGIFWQQATILGQANHAGASPSTLRKNAGLAAARIICALQELSEISPLTLTTVGSLHLEPDLINVIPGKATLTIDLRDPDAERLLWAKDEVLRQVEAIAEKDQVEISLRTLADFPPTLFDAGMIGQIEDVSHELGYSTRRMMSGAGHDAQMMTALCPVGMIFVPSHGGYSHCPQEKTQPVDLERGAQVLLHTALTLL